MMKSSALERGEIHLSDYEYVLIYDSEKASFIELELERVLEGLGLSVIGEKEAEELPQGSVLATRYTEASILNGYGNPIGDELTLLLEDYTTDRTLLTVRGRSRDERSAAWDAVVTKLKEAFREGGGPRGAEKASGNGQPGVGTLGRVR